MSTKTDLAKSYGCSRPDEIMDLLDYFAAKAMQGMLADPSVTPRDKAEFAKNCYDIAAAMVAEKARRDDEDHE